MNVLVIMCDQLRYDAIGYHGNPYVSTPNLDRLAARSVRFTRAYVNSPLCGPTRHSLATGLYPYQHGVINNVALPLEGMQTIAHHLKLYGYRSVCIGHMHWQRIETGDGRDDVFTDHGYDEYLAIHPDTSGLTEAQKKRQLWEQVSKPLGGPSTVPEAHSYSRQIADASIAKLRAWKASGEPFLNWTSFNDPHPPFFPPADYYARYAAIELPPPQARPPEASPSQEEVAERSEWQIMTPLNHRVIKTGYHGLVELADYHIGRILDTLDELDLWKDTVVCFLADHGEMLGDHGRYFKSVMWEQATHIPCYIYHPDLAPGERHALMEHIDLYPTLCELLNIPRPEGISGRSLKDLLVKDDPDAPGREYVFSQLNNRLMVRTARWKLMFEDAAPTYLFDLENDANEWFDVKDKHPDVVRELVALLERDHPGLAQINEDIQQSGRVRKHKRKPIIVLADAP